jgi:uncharacterized lipoprotein NlpE involved in copper resistance
MPTMTYATRPACLLLVLAVAACNRSPADAAGAPPAPGPTVVAEGPQPVAAAPGTTMAVAGVQPDDAGVDAKALAGTFLGTLPCADCPGIDESLVLSADGTYEMTDVYRDRPGSDNVIHGSWSVESGGHGIRLDPGSKDAQDRRLAIEDNDTLVPLGADGQPTAMPGDPRLRRSR